MKDIYTLVRLDQLKALADPLRQRILEGFCAAPQTTKHLAQRLGEKPTRLYHHVNALEDAGLIVLIETRQNRGTTEKYYRSVARQFAVDHRLLAAEGERGEASAELQALLVNTLQESLAQVRSRFDRARFTAGAIPAVVGHPTIRTSPERAAELTQQLQSWLAAFQNAHDETGEVEYSLVVALYPLTSNPQAPEP